MHEARRGGCLECQINFVSADVRMRGTPRAVERDFKRGTVFLLPLITGQIGKREIKSRLRELQNYPLTSRRVVAGVFTQRL